MATNFRKLYAVKMQNEQRWLRLNPQLNNKSGIYILTRMDENGFRYAYVGQAKHILERLCSHSVGYQHIDLSLKKHKLYSAKNPYGWKVVFQLCEETELDDNERRLIKQYANNGFQMRNKTNGGQENGKSGIDNNSGGKGYHDGLKQGYENCRKEISEYFEKYLNFAIKEPILNKNGKPNAIKQKKYEEFVIWLKKE